MLRVRSDGTIDLRVFYQEPATVIEAAISGSDELMVYREGEVRRVPAAIFLGMTKLYHDFGKMKEAGRIPAIPASSYTLHWDDLPSETASEPRPSLRPRTLPTLR